MSRSPHENEGKAPAKQDADKAPSGDQVSRALRSVYDDMLREDVPSEFEDLLKKLK